MKDYRLNEQRIGEADVIVDIVPGGKCIPNIKIQPTSITVHMTGNPNTSAQANHNYMKNINKSGKTIASWHFTVDDAKIIQAQSTNYKTFHAGNAKGNSSSIGIEICMFDDVERQLKAYKNAIALIKVLMEFHNFKQEQVVRHYDWSRKHCPAWLIEGKFGYTWEWFKQEIVKKPESLGAKEVQYKVKIIYKGTEGLNVRQQPDIQGRIMCVVKYGEVYTIVAEKDGWGKLKSGVGWISLNGQYVQKI